MNVAIVGYGKVAREEHVPAIAAIPGIELVAIASLDGGMDGIPWFPTFESLLGSDTEFDAVAICTPPQSRGPYAALALDSGRHVLLEKPPGVSVAEIAGLSAMAECAKLTLFTAWHARYTKAVAHARALIAANGATAIDVAWRENVRVSHPGQQWLWQPGGLGVLDLGSSALSILTEIIPEALVVTAAELSIPSNRENPIAARLHLSGPSGLQVTAEFDYRQRHDQHWDIEIQSSIGTFALSSGGRLLTMGGRILADGPVRQYHDIYRTFQTLVQTGRSDVDTTPLAHIADAFSLGRRIIVEPFED